MIIDIQHVSKYFGGIVALENCTLTIEEEMITGLIGPNGAGKTTLFNIIAGTLKPDDGRVLFDGRDITGMPPHRLFHEGIVRTFQIPHEFSRMTVRENLMLVPPAQLGETLVSTWFRWPQVLAQERAIAERVDEVLAFLNMSHVADLPAGALSGGQKKLLELGRTMMTDAKLVLLDEPGAGVNRSLLTHLVDAIRRLNREHGYTFCIIEHDMDLVSDLCDPVIAMMRGHILAQGTMAEVRSHPEVLEAYFGQVPEAAAR